MRPNPRELEAMIQAARTDAATPEAITRAVTTLRRPAPRPAFFTVPRVALAAASVAVVMVLPLLTPRSSGAWAQVAAETAKQNRYRERVFVRINGKTSSGIERWVDGKRYSFQWIGGRNYATFGCDGRRSYRIYHGDKYVTIENRPSGDLGSYLAGMGNVRSFSVDDLIHDEKVRPVGEAKEIETPQGKRLVYTVEYLNDPKKGDLTVNSVGRFYTVPGDSRIRKWELLDNKGESNFFGEVDYPASIPDNVFAFTPPAGYRIYDLDQGRNLLRKTIEKGLGTKTVNGHSVTLRAVVAGSYRDVNVLWTGTPPNGDLQPPIKIEGLPVQRAYGLSIMTTKVYEYVPPVKKLDYLPTFLSGMSVQTTGKVPDRVTVTIPVFAPDKTRPVYDFEGRKTGFRSRYVGKVTYRNVPVLKPGPFYNYLRDLGLQEPERYEALVRKYKGKPKR